SGSVERGERGRCRTRKGRIGARSDGLHAAGTGGPSRRWTAKRGSYSVVAKSCWPFLFTPLEATEMQQAKAEQRRSLNSFAGMGAMPTALHNPMMSIFAEMNGTLLESAATAQKDWMDFVHRRIKEDV